MISKQIYGVNITEDIIRELRQNGRSHVLTMKDKVGKQYLGRFVVKGDRVEVVAEGLYLEHRCPHCGGRIRITSKGYFCENSLGKQPTCKFHCNGILSHRFILPHEIEAFLDGHPTVLDGCFNSQGRIFSAVLTESEVYGMSLTSVVGKCQVCGGDVLVSPVAFNCCCHEDYHGPLAPSGHGQHLINVPQHINIGDKRNEQYYDKTYFHVYNIFVLSAKLLILIFIHVRISVFSI